MSFKHWWPGFGRKPGYRARKTRMGTGLRPQPQPRQPQHLQWAIVLLAFVVLTIAVTRRPPSDAGPLIDEEIGAGDVAFSSLQAEFRFQSEDLQATRERAEAAAAAVPHKFRVDYGVVQEEMAQLEQRIDRLLDQDEQVRTVVLDALNSAGQEVDQRAVVAKAVADLARQLTQEGEFEHISPEACAVWLTPSRKSLPKRVFEALPAEGHEEAEPGVDDQDQVTVLRALDLLSNPGMEDLEYAWADRLAELATASLRHVLARGIVEPGRRTELIRRERLTPADDGGGETDHVVVVRDATEDDLKLIEDVPFSDLVTLTEADRVLRRQIRQNLETQLGAVLEDPVDLDTLEQAAWELARAHLTSTLRFDEDATEGDRELARASVEPAMKDIEAGDYIQRKRKVWTEQSLLDAHNYASILSSGQKQPRILWLGLAHGVYVFLALLFLMRALDVLRDKRDPCDRNLNAALLLICASLVVGRVVYYFVELDAGFLVPVMAMAMLLAILTNTRVALVSALLTSLLLAVQYGYSMQLLAVSMVMSLTAILSIYAVRRRSDITRAAIKATAAGLVTAGAMAMASDALFNEATGQRLALILMNGMACLFIVPGLLSPLERLFRVTTDIQLLEYSDLNNEILSQMAIEIPATYAHSLALGQLAEAAANAVGANGLLARVCAYYHDIGKIRRPEYFSENQRGANIHDELSPRHSSRAIAAHATQGVEIAREYHLPEPIVDGIREHHGTCLISFFYQQALDKHRHGDVQEEDFRYPGPRPHRPETAILMICDAVESGIRSLRNPNEERVREFVDKIIRSRWQDRQFDECDLTLRDLDRIATVVAQHIMSSLHTRVAYPDLERETPADNVIPLSGGGQE